MEQQHLKPLDYRNRNKIGPGGLLVDRIWQTLRTEIKFLPTT